MPRVLGPKGLDLGWFEALQVPKPAALAEQRSELGIHA